MFLTNDARRRYNIKSDEFEELKKESSKKYKVNLGPTKITENIKKVSKVKKTCKNIKSEPGSKKNV